MALCTRTMRGVSAAAPCASVRRDVRPRPVTLAPSRSLVPAHRGFARSPAYGRPAERLRVRLFENNKQPEVGDRVVAALPYILPLLDVFPYGKFIFLQFPYVAALVAPLLPVYILYSSIPFAAFVAFLGVYTGLVNNYNLPRFVRYNAMQAVLLDILLIIPQVLLDNVFKRPSGGLELQAYISANNTVFLFVATSVAYGLGSCLVGQTPRLPLVAEAADAQVRDGPSGF